MRFLELKIPPPLVTAALAVAVYLSDKALPQLHFFFPARIPLSLVFAAVGVLVSIAGVRAFRRHRTTVNPLEPGKATSLVTDGVFRWTRNPMYLGFLLILTSWAIWLSSAVSLGAPPLLALYLTRFQILPEERVMHTLFGNEWTSYKRRVRRWL